MKKSDDRGLADPSVIQTQTKIIVLVFGIFIIGLLLLFLQNLAR